MSKNLIIGLLIVIVLGGGYYFLTTNQNTQPPQSNTNTQIPPATVPTNNKDNSVPPISVNTPTAETSSSVSASNSSAAVTGQVTANGIPTAYWFEYGKTTTLGSKTTVQQIGSSFAPFSAPGYISVLDPDTTYYFRLVASNIYGAANGNTYTFKTNSNPSPKAATPTVRTSGATGTTNIAANLNGQINPNGWQTNYWFEYGKTNTFGSISSIKSITDSATFFSNQNVSVVISGLLPSTKYYFRLNAQDQFGTVNGSILTFTTPRR